MAIWVMDNGVRATTPVDTHRTTTPLEPTAATEPVHSTEDEHYRTLEHQRQISPYQGKTTLPPEREEVLTVGQIMTSPVLTLYDDQTLRDAWIFFRDHQFRHVPILGRTGRITGILSDRDILREVGEGDFAHPIRDHMASRLLTTTPQSTIREVARVLFENRIGAMPVLSEAGQLVGMITRSDILKTLMNNVAIELWV